MSTEQVAIIDLADDLGTRKQTVFKIARRLGIEAQRSREVARGNQFIALVTIAEAGAIREAYCSRRGSAPVLLDDPDNGWFYVIQLEPEHDPRRVKFGFTTDLADRLRKHRCSAPFAVYAETWPCRRSWERAAIDSLSAGLEQLHTEVFRIDSVADGVARGNRFFAVMPVVEQGDKLCSLKRLVLAEL